MEHTVITPKQKAEQIYFSVLGTTSWGEVLTPELHRNAIRLAVIVASEVIEAGISFQSADVVNFYDKVREEIPLIVNDNIKK